MFYTDRLSSSVHNGSIPATERALFLRASDYAEVHDRTIRGVYYTKLTDPITNYTLITIKVWLR
jgi:hypothetical protein